MMFPIDEEGPMPPELISFHNAMKERVFFMCPVCGYPELHDDPLTYSEEICPSCWYQFGYSYSEGYDFDSWREKWVAGGMKWSSKGIPQPKDWDGPVSTSCH